MMAATASGAPLLLVGGTGQGRIEGPAITGEARGDRAGGEP